jgi:hypothetical protein
VSLRRNAPAAGLALLAAAVRLPGVWHNALSQDEVASARILQEPTFLGAVHRIVRTESTPPLWYALGWVVRHLGAPLVDVRLLSVAFGALLAALVYRLACTVVRPGYAAFAAALVAVGYEPVYHGSELRSYELLALLAVVTCTVLLRHAQGPSRRLDVSLAAAVWAGLMTHYFFVYVVAAALAWLWLDPGARAVRRRATAAMFAGGALATPWLPAFVAQYGHDRFWWIGPFKPEVVLVTPLRLFLPFRAQSLSLALAVIVIAGAGAVLLARRSPAGRLIALLGILPIVVAGTAWAAGERSYAVRNLIETAPFLAVSVAAALSAVPRRVAATALAATAATAIAVVAVTQSTASLPPYQRVARALVSEGWRPSDPIAVFGNVFSFRAPLEWYLPHGPLLDVSLPTSRACGALFVIVRDEPARRMPQRDVLDRERAGDFFVERLSDVRAERVKSFRRATLLASTRTPARCVQLSRNPRLEPLT